MEKSQEILDSPNKLADTFKRDMGRFFPGGSDLLPHRERRIGSPMVFKENAFFCGYSREEFQTLLKEDFFNIVYQEDRGRVMSAVITQPHPDIYFRLLHRQEGVKWCRMNGVVEESDSSMLYGFITEMPAQAQLLKSIADEMADEIYVIHKETYELLYISTTLTVRHMTMPDI